MNENCLVDLNFSFGRNDDLEIFHVVCSVLLVAWLCGWGSVCQSFQLKYPNNNFLLTPPADGHFWPMVKDLNNYWMDCGILSKYQWCSQDPQTLWLSSHVISLYTDGLDTKSGTDIHGFQRMIPNYFGNPLIFFPSRVTTRLKFVDLSRMSQQQLDWLPWNSVRTFVLHSRWIVCTLEISRLFI